MKYSLYIFKNRNYLLPLLYAVEVSFLRNVKQNHLR